MPCLIAGLADKTSTFVFETKYIHYTIKSPGIRLVDLQAFLFVFMISVDIFTKETINLINDLVSLLFNRVRVLVRLTVFIQETLSIH